MSRLHRTSRYHFLILSAALAAWLAAMPARAQLVQVQPADPDKVRLRTAALLGGTSLAVALYGRAKWWQEGFDNRLDVKREGWFGQRSYSGGADKLGHFYMNYAATRLLARTLAHAGNDPGDALRIAAWYTLGTFTAIEVLDGYAKKWHLSPEDMLMNAGGAGLGVLLENHPALDRLLDFRMLYWRSRDPGASFDPFGDYSGQTYLLVVKASGVEALRHRPLLRYLELAAGYGTRGYASDRGVYGSRNLYVGVSLNLSDLIGARASPTRGRVRQAADIALEYVQVPGTVGLKRIRLGAD